MSLPGKWIAFDPGESTGYAVCEGSRLVEAGTADLWVVIHSLGAALAPLPGLHLVDTDLLKTFRGAEEIIYEDWAIYPWKAKELAWDQCRTARGIGAIELIGDLSGVKYRSQPAKIKETALAAGAADMFLRPQHENRHANDAIMHSVVYALRNDSALVQD